MAIDPVEHGAADLRLVLHSAFRRLGAGARRIVQKAAAAWVHRGDQLKARRVVPCRCERHRHRAIFQRLAEPFDTRTGNSGSSSRKSTPWCARLISPGFAFELPPTSAGRLVPWCGSLNWRFRKQPAALQKPGDAMDHGYFQSFRRVQWRQNSRQAGSQHRLARAGRPHHQQVVNPRRRHFQSALRGFLPLDVAQVPHAGRHRFHMQFWRGQYLRTLEMIYRGRGRLGGARTSRSPAQAASLPQAAGQISRRP